MNGWQLVVIRIEGLGSRKVETSFGLILSMQFALRVVVLRVAFACLSEGTLFRLLLFLWKQ